MMLAEDKTSQPCIGLILIRLKSITDDVKKDSYNDARSHVWFVVYHNITVYITIITCNM